jgi:hypothetical protein
MNTETANETIADAVRRELDCDPKVNANSLGVTTTRLDRAHGDCLVTCGES